jgi:hypothetical protein
VRSLVTGLLALPIIVWTGSPAVTQSPGPTGPTEAASASIGPEEAVAHVLASDPRFADLPSYEVLEQESAARFSYAPYLTSGFYRVLGPTLSELEAGRVVTLRHGLGWLVETTLVAACTTPPQEPAYPLLDPCAWRHTTIHFVAPDGTLTRVSDAGDPEPMPSSEATAPT